MAGMVAAVGKILKAIGAWLPVLSGAVLWALIALSQVVKALFRFLRYSVRWGVRAIGAAVLLYLFGVWAFHSPRNIPYRYSPPASDACIAQYKQATALSVEIDQTNFIDWLFGRKRLVTNDELAVLENNPALRDTKAFTCMLQTHEVVPPGGASRGQPLQPVRYHLAFLEFTEEGRPAEWNEGNEGLVKPSHEPPTKDQGVVPPENKRAPGKAQLEELRNHLNSQKENFVVVFIHGWRHDASIGDDNVKNLRVYAAFLKSFLNQRCRAEQRYCETEVTAVYVGWRGARVNEKRIEQVLGTMIGANVVAPALAIPTLFDRKPVSERIGPSAVSALVEIDRTLDARNRNILRPYRDRMVTIGHSLGGNMLASALVEQMADRIRRHEHGSVMTPPFGDLIILINPASEAANWTALQRAMREKIRFGEFDKELEAGHAFYPVEQPPVYVSVTSARLWPAGGLRESDRAQLRRMASVNAKGREECDEVRVTRREILTRVQYDWATHDLFPLFRGDFRPLAETVEYFASTDEDLNICDSDTADRPLYKKGLLGIAALLRNMPFMNTNFEQTHTIGHLNPMRPPYGTLDRARGPSTVYGTTHELVINREAAGDVTRPADYLDAAVPARSECALVTGWLRWARERIKKESPHGTRWDSGYTVRRTQGQQDPRTVNLTPVRSTSGPILESQFRHGLAHAGTVPIIRANDPFWNVRAFDTAIADHGGYASYPFICALHQLVMDAVGAQPSNVPQPSP